MISFGEEQVYPLCHSLVNQPPDQRGARLILEPHFAVLGPDPKPFSAYTGKVYFVPAVFMTNSLGISRLKATIASNPVQWAGTIMSGFMALMSATVL